MILTLLQNISLLVAIAVVYHFVERRLGDKPLLASLLGGLLFGVAAIIAMLTPFRFHDGIIYDGRTIILAAASLFGGPIASGIATAAALALRIFYIGGVGRLAGSLSIITAAGIGLASYYWRIKSRKALGSGRIIAIGFIVHLFMLASQLLLPDERWRTTIPTIALPVLLLYPLGFFFICSLFIDNEERLKNIDMLRDMTRTLEQRVAKRTEELEEVNRELESFAYSVSHDLRVPLRAMEGFSKLLAEEAGENIPSSTRHYVDRIGQNARKASRLIDDILRLSRISRQTLLIADIDISSLAGEVASEIGAAYPGKKVELSIQAGMRTKADKALMEILLANLLGNAWKFTSAIPEATIRMESLDMEGETVYAVSDNGAGFDMRYADKLFTPFQRLHNEDEYPGSGIGLSIVRRIAARHGGRVWVKASPNEGATFYFTLGG